MAASATALRFACALVGALLATLLAPVSDAETLLVVRKSADALDLVDPGSGMRLASVAVGHGPHEVAASADGRVAVVSNYGTRETPGSTLSVIDLAHPRELRRIDLAPNTRPHGVAWAAADRVAVTTEGSSNLLLVDPYTGRIVATQPTQQDTSHMVTVDNARAYVANIGSGSTSVVSLGGDAPSLVIATGAGSEGIARRPGHAEVWVTARSAGSIAIVDTASLRIIARLALSGVPIRVAFSPDGTRAYVTCAGSSELVVFDAESRRELARRRLELPLARDARQRPFAALAPGSALPVGLAVAPDGRTVYVAATMADAIVVLDARTLDPIRSIRIDGEPDGLALTFLLPQATCHACAAPAEPVPPSGGP